MNTRPTHHPPQTLAQAKATYKKYGLRISSQEKRRNERGAVLLERAAKIREREKKAKAARRRKREKEVREREARARLVVKSQGPNFSPRQGPVGGWVGVGKGMVEEVGGRVGMGQGRRCVGEGNGDGDGDPWDMDGMDEGDLLDTVEPVLGSSEGSGCSSFHCERDRIGTQDKDGVHLSSEPKKPPEPGYPEDAILWDDFVASSTQVEREISAPGLPPPPMPRQSKQPARPPLCKDPSIPPLSTQDVSFSLDDLEDPGPPDRSLQTPSKAAPPPSRLQPPQTKPPDKTVNAKQQQPPLPRSKPLKSSAEKARDRGMMLPPPLRLPSRVTPTFGPRAALAGSEDPPHRSRDLPAELAFVPADFDLSSQDCREILA